MRNLLVCLAGGLLLGSAFVLFSRATWGEPIDIDALQPTHVRDNAAVQEEVRAKKVVLVNDMGKAVAVFGMFKDQPSLIMRDQNNKVRAVLALREAGQPQLVLFDGTGKRRAQFDTQASEPRLMLFDGTGKCRAQFDTEKDEPRFMLFDADRNVTFQAPQ